MNREKIIDAEIIEKKKSKLPLILLVLVLLIACGIGIYYYQLAEKEKAHKALYNSLKVEFTEEIPYVEYGSDFDEMQFVQHYEGTVTYHDELDTSKVGMQQLKYVVTVEDEAFGTVTRDSFYTATVKDTQVPVITLNAESVTLEYGAEFDVKSNIKEVSDPVDGDLEYTLEGEVDTSAAGEYVVIVTTKDTNGNEATATYTVVVNEKKQSSSSSKNTNKGNSGSSNSSSSKCVNVNSLRHSWNVNPDTGEKIPGTDSWTDKYGNMYDSKGCPLGKNVNEW